MVRNFDRVAEAHAEWIRYVLAANRELFYAGAIEALRTAEESRGIRFLVGLLIAHDAARIGDRFVDQRPQARRAARKIDRSRRPGAGADHAAHAADFTAVLAEHLRRVSGRGAHEAEDGEPVLAGGIYLAPGGRHMRVVRDGDIVKIALGDDPPINFCKPSVDPLFSTAAAAWGSNVLAVVLTGMGSDGTHGAADIVAAGGSVIAQDEATSVVLGDAALGRPGRPVLGGPAARSNSWKNSSPAAGEPIVTPLDYDFLRRALKQRSGLVLSADKQYLVESRLLPVARKAGLANLGALVEALKAGDGEALMNAVVEAMATNESFFFRDKIPFEHFRSIVMPALLAARRASRTIRIWCAAASTGQEPYSLAMCLKSMEREIAGWRIDILATDLSNEVLEKARAGLYSQFEVQRGLPIQLLIKHFTQVGELWQVGPDIRAMVKFRQLNLLSNFSSLGMFDLIFCRNVLIYFDQQTKIDVLESLARVTASDGYLVLGAAETVVGLTDSFKVVGDKHGLYAPNARSPKPFMPMAGGKPMPRLVAVNGGR